MRCVISTHKNGQSLVIFDRLTFFLIRFMFLDVMGAIGVKKV